MKTVCQENRCTGCMACVDVCPTSAITILDELNTYNAVISEDLCIHCNACDRVCQNTCNSCRFKESITWYQGWSLEEKNRRNSSSGSAAYELARAIINRGGCVFSCLFSKGEFKFAEADTIIDLNKFSGSKYVKSNPTGVYGSVEQRLKEGRQVLFIGLPCQVEAMNQFVGEVDNLYTVDLICHGTPSPKVLDIFLKQYKCSLEILEDIRFRTKDLYQIIPSGKTFVPIGVRDPYMIAFLNGLIYTENCYRCSYARKERVADITIGDSWQSDFPVSEQKKGISLILIQTEKGNKLIQETAMQLNPVNFNKAVEANQQLQHPSVAPAGRDVFFKELRKGKSFNALVKRNFPKQYVRQNIKAMLIRNGIISSRAIIDYRIYVEIISGKKNS